MTPRSRSRGLDESARLAALHATELLDTPPEEAFDRLTRLAARLLDAPVALVSLVDAERQFFKSCVGLPEPWSSKRETPLSFSVCRHVVASGAPLVIEDARTHPLVRDDPAVHDFGVMAYLGIPLVIAPGLTLGSLCVTDTRPRTWTEDEVAILTDIAGAASSEIALRAEIAERKRVEAELRESEARYERISANVPGFVYQFVIEPDGRSSFPSHNNGLPEIFGHHLEAARFDGRALLDMIHPEDRPSYDLTAAESSRTLTPWHWQGRIIGVTGKVHWIQVASRPVRMPDGRIIRDGLLLDVTEHHRAEVERAEALDALRASEDRFRSAFDHASIGMALTALDGRWESVNPALCRILGYSEAELLGRNFQEISHPDELPDTLELLRQLLAGERVSYQVEKRYIHKEGHAAWVLVDVTLSRDADGRPRNLIAQVQDISRRKRAEAELHAANATLQSLVDLAPQAIIAVDLEWHVTRWNHAAEQLFGWTAADVLGGPLPIVPDDRIDEFRARQTFAVQAQGAAGYETQRMRKDGRVVDVLLSTGVLRGADGKPTGYIAIVSDLTEHKALEAQLRQAQKMEAVGQLAGGIAHDFNNLLTAVKVHAELLLDGLEPGSPQHNDVEEINKAAARAASLTRQLLAFSRKQLLKPQVLDLNATVSNVAPMLRRLIGEDIEIVTRLEPALGPVRADPVQLEQVLLNLGVNSRDAMPQGGVLVIETANVGFDPTSADRSQPIDGSEPYVMLAVTDSGCGMDRRTQARVFEPFFTTKGPGKGTGLGLSTVYGIVKQSGGYIWVSSVPNQGTTFKIYLPRTTPRTPTPAMSMAPVVPHGSETLLLIEDEEAVRRLARRVLEGHGYTVLEASHGGDALQLAAGYEERIDLVITDIVMPGLTGRALVERLAEGRPGFKVIFMSGYTDDEIIRRGLLEPGVEFLEKPFTVDGLARTVREVLDAPDRGRWPVGA